MSTPSVVVVGAGQAGSQAALSLRENGFDGRVTIVGDEAVLPYQRPPLTKQYLAGDAGVDELLVRPESFYRQRDIDVLTHTRVTSIDRDARAVALRSGRVLPYEHLILATGARPRPLPVPGAGLDGVLSVRSIADADQLRDRLDANAVTRVVVVGGGFVGLELAAVARKRGHTVTVVEALPRVLTRGVSARTSSHLTGEHLRHGVRVLLGAEVAALHGSSQDGHVDGVELDDGARLPADLVVVGIGVLPAADIAAAAGLATENGVVVDEHLRTADPHVFAIGDCANFPSPHAGRRLRLESVQNAVDQGIAVARTICGTPTSYDVVPWFWSDQYDIKLQIAGITDGHDQTIVTGDLAGGRFSVYCFRRDRLLGVESINKPADYIFARRLLTAGGNLTPELVSTPGFELRLFMQQQQEAAAA